MKRFFLVVFLGAFFPSLLGADQEPGHGSVSFFSMPEKTVRSVKERREKAEAASAVEKDKKKQIKKSPSAKDQESDSLSGLEASGSFTKLLEMIQKFLGMGTKDKEEDFLGDFKKQESEMDKVVDEALQSQA